jgi:hypothetical protein
MNSLQFILTIFSLLFVAFPAGSQARDADSWSPTWINPSWERPSNMIPDSQISLPGDLTVDQLERPTLCGGCHNEIFEQWKGGVHANALNDPIFQKVSKLFLAEAETEGELEEAQSCVRCHTPFGHLSGEIATTEDDFDNKNLDLLQTGIFCGFCHSVKSTAGIGNAPYTVSLESAGENKLVKWGPRDDAVSPYHGTAFSELHTRSEICGTCHDVTHTLNGMPIERTYTEWREGPYNTGDPETTVYCQDCHMRQLPGVPATGSTERPDNPGVSGIGGKERDHVYTHYHVGGNTALPSLFEGGEENSLMATERLQNCATLEISAPSLPLIWQQSTIQIKVNNVGAGHYLPTGLSEVREMWLEVIIKDALGRIIFQSGTVDNNGNVDPQARSFSIKLADKDGNYTVNVVKADHILSDTRIPPKGSATEQFSFLVPITGILGYTIEATLNYRSAPQSLIDDLFADETFDLPIIEMTSATAEVKLVN